MRKLVIVYVTCNSKQEAQRIGASVVNDGLAACANWVQGKSCYLWKGKLEKGSEAILILKTKPGKVPELRKKVKLLHSYEAPCILELDATANKEYYEWVDGIL